ncbi:MAG: Tm-1-like ATP-binding domain-containing protein [Actinobacteria bacterium]|nr:Tm-1-like ATP-binding domain-containing protein [Actinomycetota bacterium]
MNIAIIATIDTKLEESIYMKDYIEKNNLGTILIDVGVFRDFEVADINIKKILKEKNYDLKKAILVEKRSEIIEKIGLCCGEILESLYKRNEIDGVISIGGNQGTAIFGIAIQKLPFFLPKVLVTTIASGNMRPYIKNKDIFTVFSITDFAGGINFINKCVVDNALDSIVAMAKNKKICKKPDKKVIAITAFGNTSKGAIICADLLKKLDFSPVIFHSSGAGGSAMEDLIDNNYVDGVIDLTPHEIIGEIFNFDIYKPTSGERLVSASKKGIPQVLSTGGLDYFVFGPPDTMPRFLQNRKIHYHNPYNTNVRISGKELIKVADLMAKRINGSRGPVALLIPMKGWSEIGSINNILYDNEANNMFVNRVEKKIKLSKNKILEKINKNINSPEFCEYCVKRLNMFFDMQSNES